MKTDRIVHLAPDPLFLEVGTEFVTIGDLDGVLMENARSRDRWGGLIAECPWNAAVYRAACCRRPSLQRARKGSLAFRTAAWSVSRRLLVRRIPLVVIFPGTAMEPETLEPGREGLVLRDHHAAVTPGAEVLAGKERRARRAQPAGDFPLPVHLATRADGLGPILDHRETVLLRDRQDPLHGGHLAEQMDDHDAAGRGVMAASIAAGAMFQVSGSISTKTGVPPAL